MEKLLKAMNRMIINQQIKPLPYTRFFASQIKDALNYFLKAQHIGKIVVAMPEIKENLGQQFKSDLLFSNNGTYLVTGGLGGIGLEVAKWMVKCGARHVVLVGRNVPTEKTLQVLRSLSCKGVQVFSRQVDVGNFEQCVDLFAAIKAEMPPLRGVIHSAGVLSDAMIQNQTWEKFETVFNAKVKGGWNLHHLTKNMTLEHFVLFSSMVAVVGGLGQANHCAANMFLDSLAFYRHSLGLPAQTINWGAWSEVGAATNTSYGKEGAFGVKPFSPSQGIAALQFTMRQPIVQVSIIQMKANEICELAPMTTKYLSELPEGQCEDCSKISSQDSKFWNEVESLNEDDRTTYIKKYLEFFIRQTLKLPESEVLDDHQTFSEMGLDSLMAVEMRNKLQQIFGKHLTLNPTTLLDYPTLIELSKYMAQLTMKVDSKIVSNVTTEKEIQTTIELSLLDSILPNNIKASNKPIMPSEIKFILMTGVTGHLGPYLLKQLVEKDKIRIICLIRANTIQLAEKRLELNLKKFDLCICLNKVSIVLGDITQTNLGLNPEDYEMLVRKVDAVFHCAAKVNHIERYKDSKSGKDIRSVNVLGTINILGFAANCKTKRVAFMSSFSAANMLNDDGIIPDDFPTEENKGDGLELGYPLTKFVSEKLMAQANQRGIPCTVLRFPSLIGNSLTGHFTTDPNFIMNYIFTSARLKVCADVPGGWNILPVDVAAKISAEILFNDNSDIGLYNIIGNEPATTLGFMKVFEEMGIPLQLVTLNEFKERLHEDPYPLMDVFLEALKGKSVEESLLGFSPFVKAALAEGKQILKMGHKLRKAVYGVEEMIPSPLVSLRRHINFGINSGIYDQMGIEYKKP